MLLSFPWLPARGTNWTVAFSRLGNSQRNLVAAGSCGNADARFATSGSAIPLHENRNHQTGSALTSGSTDNNTYAYTPQRWILMAEYLDLYHCSALLSYVISNSQFASRRVVPPSEEDESQEARSSCHLSKMLLVLLTALFSGLQGDVLCRDANKLTYKGHNILWQDINVNTLCRRQS